MPFDGNERDFQKPDVFSIEALIAWLETQNPEVNYDYTCVEGRCLIGRYLTETTGQMWAGHGWFWGDLVEAYPWINPIAVQGPWTYGAALDRAKKLRARQ